jgi:hypothetical protein
MLKVPTIGKLMDAEEGELFCTTESDGYKHRESFLTPEHNADLQRRRVQL